MDATPLHYALVLQVEVQAQQLTTLEEHGKLARQKQEQQELRERVGHMESYRYLARGQTVATRRPTHVDPLLCLAIVCCICSSCPPKRVRPHKSQVARCSPTHLQ